MSYRADKQVITAHTDGRTDTQTDAGNDNTRRPKVASGKKRPQANTVGWNRTLLSLEADTETDYRIHYYI